MPFDALVVCLLLVGLSQSDGATNAWADYRPDGPSYVRVQGEILQLGGGKIGEWEARTDSIYGLLRLPRDPFRHPAAVAGLANVGVYSLKVFRGDSPVGEKGDALIHETLKAAEHPEIVFTLTSLDLEMRANRTAQPLRCVAHGLLQVAGVTNKLSAPIHLHFLEPDLVIVEGQFTLKMSSFSIDPPGGKIHEVKSSDEVSISFKWQLKLGSASSSTSQLDRGHNQPVERMAAAARSLQHPTPGPPPPLTFYVRRQYTRLRPHKLFTDDLQNSDAF